MPKPSSLASLLVLAAAALGAAPPPPPPRGADLVLIGGRVLTMDAANTIAEAVAVTGDRIVAVGSSADIRKMAGTATRTIDLQGRTVLPGFIDSRIHGPFGFWEASAGTPLIESDGSPMSHPDAIETRLRQWIADHAPAAGVWIVGAGFNPKLAVTRGFDRTLADRIAPDNPLVLLSLDHHVAVVNGKAIELGVLKDLDARLDTQGAPTGLVREGAVFMLMNRIWSLQPEPVRLEATQRFEETATRFGITTVGNPMIVPEDLTVAEGLIADGRMPVRLVAGALGSNAAARAALDDYRRRKNDARAVRLAVGPPLYLLDGTLLGWGAAQFQVYKDSILTSGLLAMSPEAIDRLVGPPSGDSVPAGDGVVVDATGSLAVHLLFDAVEKQPAVHVRADGLEVMTPADRERLPRVARSGLIASLQPTRFPFRLFLQSSIGEQQMTQAMPYRALVEAGVPVAINSDWPMTAQTFKPTQIIEWAVTRAGWHPEEGLTIAQALGAYTRDAARALGMLDRIGTLEAGKQADLVVLDANPLDLSATPDRISDIAVRLTVSSGSIEFEDRPAASAAAGAGAAGRLKK